MNAERITLHKRDHETYEEGHCLLEETAHLAGGPHTDEPADTCRVFAAFGRALNDAYGDDDERRTRALGPAAEPLIGTKGSPKDERRRAYALADLAVRRWAPMALEAAGLTQQAEKLRKLDRVENEETARATAANAANAYAAYAARCFIALLKGEDPWEVKEL